MLRVKNLKKILRKRVYIVGTVCSVACTDAEIFSRGGGPRDI